MTGTKVVATEEYAVISLKAEYPGYEGLEKYAVFSDLGKEELERKYAAELAPYTPYVLLTEAEGEAFSEFNRNENKFHTRQHDNMDAYGYEEGVFETFHSELVQDNLFDIVSDHLDKEKLIQALPKLKDTQRRRVEMYYFEGHTVREIAEIEGVDKRAVQDSLKYALKKLKSLLDD